MPSTKATFQQMSDNLLSEHQELLQGLAELDRALEGVICHSEVYADLSGVQTALETVRRMTDGLRAHFVEEEQGIFARINRLGPESAEFAREMKRQHKEINERVESFCKVADSFKEAADLQQSVWDLKEAGKTLAGFMTTHMGAEERKYATLK